MKLLLVRLALLLALGLPSLGTAHAQGTWTEDAGLLSSSYVAWAGQGYYYTQRIYIRGGQQTVRFDTGWIGASRMEVRVKPKGSASWGAWEVVHNGS